MGVSLSIAHLEDKDWSAWKNFEKRKFVEIHHRCRVLKKISWETLWIKFLGSSSTSFAIAPPELTYLLENSVHENIDIATDDLKAEIKDYLEFVKERNSLGNEDISQSKYMDFVTVFTSVLLISDDHLEEKIDQLFGLTDFNDDGNIQLDELYLTVTSVERGLSYILGESPSSSKYVYAAAKKFFTLSEMGRESEAVDSDTQIGKKKFFEFCTNRQHSVRRLLELFGNAKMQKNTVGDLHEVVTADKLSCPSLDEPTGGDEWMANPAWKKTAEIMTPKNHTGNSSRPVSNLQLEWVHGYRGFDCRNNVRYVDKEGAEFAYTAAALGVVQTVHRGEVTKAQRYFGDHTDDIIAMSTYTPLLEEYDQNVSNITIATGEMGKKPAVYLWKPDPHTGMVSLACMSGFHTKAVCQIAHSADGLMLFTVGIEYTVAVYDIQEKNKKFGKQICSAQGPKGKILHAASYGLASATAGNYSTKFVSCGEKHIVFWELKKGGSSISQTPAKLSREYSNKMYLSASRVGNSENVVVGAHTGEILLFTDPKKAPIPLDAKLPTVPKSINALWGSRNSSGENYLLVGCKEGYVFKYGLAPDGNSLAGCASFKIPANANVTDADEGKKKKPSTNPIRSVAASLDNSKLIIGTQRCEIVEVEFEAAFGMPGKAGDSSLQEPSSLSLVAGHFKDEVWGLAVRPRVAGRAEYASVGDDGYLRIFNVEKREQSHALDMGTMSRCCAYSPDGSMLAVGYGGRVGRGKQKMDGMFRIYRINTDKPASDSEWATMIHEGRDAKQWISEVKFSEDGRILAVGSKDNSIYVYLVAHKFKLKFKFSRHNSYITHFDISSDGQYMQSNCGAYELLFCSLKDGKPVLKGSSLSSVNWATWTCTLGWPVQGIWPSSADGTDINAVDRSPSGTLIATADDFGKVKVFRYPSVELNSQFCEYSGHSSHVTNVRWVADESNGDDYVITVGGNDKCLFQWKNVAGDEASASDAKKSNQQSTDAFSSSFELEEPSGGDEFMAVKPWKGAIKEPSNFGDVDKTRVVQFFAALGELSNKHAELHSQFDGVAAKHAGTLSLQDDPDANSKLYDEVTSRCNKVFERLTDSGYASKDMPDNDEMELAWVHGYRAFDCRNNLYYADPKNDYIVYFAANVGIVFNKTTREQKYFRGHTDDILAMATINTKLADEANEVQIVASGQRGKKSTFVWTVPGLEMKSTLETGQKSICMLEFSKDARLLISIAEDNTVAVSDWANQRVVAKVDGEPAPTFHLARHNGDSNSALFLTCGDKFMRLWSLSGRNLTSTKISTAHKKASPQKFLSAVYFNNQWIIGCMDGSLYVVPDGDKKVIRVIEFQDNPSASSSGEESKPAAKSGKKAGGGKKGGKGGGKSKAKKPAITSMYCVDGLIVTGDRVGQVRILNQDLSEIHMFSIDAMINEACGDAYRLVGQFRQVQSLCYSAEGGVLLVGTRGCDVAEVQYREGETASLVPGSPLIQGHADDELWGLAVHPTRPTYCTVGDDKTMRLWDCHSRRMLHCVPLGSMARACAFSPDGNLIAVGFGGRVGRSSKVSQKSDGMVRIYSAKSFKSLVEIRDAKQWISDVKFSPDGQALAVGSHNNTVYIYDIRDASENSVSMTIRCKFSKHNSYITHMDFSADGRFMQSNCGAYELLFCDTSKGKQITSATELRDVKWSTWTGCLGWPVQGIWPAGADGTDINAVCRSNSGHLVATSDDFGMVRVLKYPCIEEGAAALDCAGHSSHVMNVRWTVADEYLISVGGNDKTIFQWKHNISSMDGTNSDSISPKNSGSTDAPETDTSSFELEEPTGGDEFMAVKPWRGAIRAPEHPPTNNPSLPSTELSLQWVHGYTSGSAGSDNSRISSNLHYNIDNNIVYPAAALGVCLNHDISGSAGSTQTYFNGHDDDVLCLAISADRRFVATGQTASKTSKGTGKICVWDAVDCRLLSEMKGAHKRGVVSVAFNPEGDKLLSIGLDNNFTHTLWSDVGGSWSRVQQSSTTKSDQKTHLYSLWISEPEEFEWNFVTGGATSVHFWKIEGSAMTKKESRFGKFPQKPIICAAGLKTKEGKFSLVTGSSTGSLYVFEKDRECKNMIENAHSGAVITLVGSKDGDFIISGGSDKCVKVWNHALQAITNCQLEQDLAKSPVNATIASLDYRFDSTNNLIVLVGTYGGEIMEISSNVSDDQDVDSKVGREAFDDSKPINFDLVADNASCLLHSHYSGELWGVAPHPVNPDLIATGGDDSTVRIWSIKQKRMLSCLVVGKDVRSVGWGPEGNILCVGFNGSGGRGKKSKSKKGKGKKGKGKKGSDEKEGSGKDSPGAMPDFSSHACAVFSFSLENYQLQFLGSGCPSGDKWVSEVKISPGGSYLGVGSHSKQLYMYNIPKESDGSISTVPDRWKKAFAQNKGGGKFKPFNKHSSAITHFDFSNDEKYFQSNCQAYELLFGIMENGKQQTKSSELAVYCQDPNYEDDDVSAGKTSWSTWTCTLGWPVQGIWQEGADGSDINSVDRSSSQSLVATADDFGLVKLFRYPCIDETAKHKSFTGHSSHVTNVRWVMDDSTLISVGGNDKCLFVWNVVK